MPLYDYDCGRCGSFREWRTMSDYEKPAQCPECGKAAKRAVATPRLGMDGQARKAHAINERSAHEPRVVNRARGTSMLGHDAHRDLTEARRKRAGGAEQPGKDGKIAKKSNHPWMVRH